jgi:hypothetical protein
VNIPADALPKSSRGVPYDPTRLNLLDGFRPTTQIIVHLGARVDPSQLIPVTSAPGAALLPSSAVQLIHYDTGERVPLFAEVDANVEGRPSEPQTAASPTSPPPSSSSTPCYARTAACARPAAQPASTPAPRADRDRHQAYAVFIPAATCSPSSTIASSRMRNFCTLPVTVSGNSSTNFQ